MRKKQLIKDRTLLKITVILLVLLCIYTLSLNSTNIEIEKEYEELKEKTDANSEQINSIIQTMATKEQEELQTQNNTETR